ncbi:hypothetical protein G7Y89_g14995 [Cudoniella acicularis]|uniref:Zn(2)-C6 fungal-type domain-containing protein n=1 Tax=Cudoniella acicularis TaxID=354080 RepID=A0A8H4QXD6_9HELO|nr:hypothetical protein G7Y89_g14995 [Cudoniella acicularis]
MSPSSTSPPLPESELDQSPTSSSAPKPAAAESGKAVPPKSRQRFKPQLSCTLCRSRKLKCDRNSPCQNCQKRGLSATCTYIHGALRRNKASPPQKLSNGKPKDFQSQVAHLEELVVSLMKKTNAINGHDKADKNQSSPENENSNLESTSNSSQDGLSESNGLKETAESFGRINIEDNQQNYVGGTHWSAILDSIACLKGSLEATKNPPQEPIVRSDSHGPVLLTGAITRATGPEILASLPGRQLTDKLVHGWFQTADIGSKPTHDTIQALLIYHLADQLGTRDASFGHWAVFGIIVRAAMRLGYHRDASHSPHISAFQGEIQRRLWSSIVHLDIQTSCQMGLPRMLREDMYDTRPPSILYDEDFDEHTLVLPSPRLDETSVPIGFSNLKGRITEVFGNIVDQANSTTPASYEEVMKLDKLLHDAYKDVPSHYLIRGMGDYEEGSLDLRTQKFALGLVYQKSRCFLHRKYLIPPKTGIAYPYPYSVTECIQASMRLLEGQIYLDSATQPGKPFHDQRWRASCIMTHDFLLAAMLLSLHIGHCVLAEPLAGENSQMGISVPWSREEMLQTLEGSYRIWEQVSREYESKESRKAAKALKAMLKKVKDVGMRSPSQGIRIDNPQSTSSAQSPPTADNGIGAISFNGSQTSRSQPQAQMPQIFQPGTGWPAYMQPPSFDSEEQTNTGMVGNSFDSDQTMTGTQINWELWDNQVINNNLSVTPQEMWNIDPNLSFSDPNSGIMNWDLLPL